MSRVEAPSEPNRDLPANQNQSAEPTQNTTESRQQLVSLYVQGSDTDARALYTATPGSSEAGWTSLERMLAPVKAFVQNGDPPYVQPVWTGEYSGVGDQKSQDAEAAQIAGPPVQTQNAAGEPVTDTLPEGQPTNMETPEEQIQTSEQPGDGVEPELSPGAVSPGGTSAAELIARAQSATTMEELDEIENLANGRVTVIDAVDEKRVELGH